MKFNKRVKKSTMALVLLTALSLVGFVGCSSDDASDSSTSSDTSEISDVSDTSGEETSDAEKTQITVWTNNRHDLEYMTEVVDNFNATSDTIEMEYVPQTENYENMISLAMSAGQAPDVMSSVSADYMKIFSESGIIQPVTDMVSDTLKEVSDLDNNKYIGLNVFDDEIYTVFTGKRSGSRFIYNAEILDELGLEVPTDVYDLPAMVKEITAAGDGDYYGIIFPGNSGPFERWLLHSAEKSGVLPYDFTTGTYNFDGFKPFLEITREMFEDGDVFPGSASMQIDPVRVQFADGKAAFHANASQEATVLTEQFPAKMEWGVADLPTLDGETKGAQASTPNNAYMLSAITEHPEEAWEVIEYFGSEDVLKGYFEGGYTLPISQYMNDKIDMDSIGRLADFAGATYEAVYPVYPTVTPEGLPYLDALWNACLPDGPDIDETIASLNESYNTALDKDVEMGKTTRIVIKDFDPLHPNDGTVEYLSE